MNILSKIWIFASTKFIHFFSLGIILSFVLFLMVISTSNSAIGQSNDEIEEMRNYSHDMGSWMGIERASRQMAVVFQKDGLGVLPMNIVIHKFFLSP